MFTGLVTDVGEVVSVTGDDRLRRIRIRSHYDPASIALGASIACSGPCLTAVAVEPVEGGCIFVGSATELDDQRGQYGPGTGWVVFADPEGNQFCILRSQAEVDAGPPLASCPPCSNSRSPLSASTGRRMNRAAARLTGSNGAPRSGVE